MNHDTRSKKELTTELGVWVQAIEQVPAPLRGVLRTMIEQMGRSAERFFTTAALAQADLRIRAGVGAGGAEHLP